MTEQPSPYRCETCGKYQLDPSEPNFCTVDYESIHEKFSDIDDDIVGRIAGFTHHNTVNCCGCASHPALQQVPETEPKCCHSTPCCLGCRQITAAAAAIKQERERIREAVSVLLDSVSKQSRKDEKKFDGYGSDYLYDRGKAAGVAIFCEQDGYKDILAIIDNGGK
jgi:hypothetical protein